MFFEKDWHDESHMEYHPDFFDPIRYGSLGVVKNIEFKIVAYLPRFFMLIFVKFYVFVYRILLYSMV